MAIAVSCPDCGDYYKLDNDNGGKFVVCECGRKFQLPEIPDDDKDYNCCPTCLTAAPAKATLCTGCGYNFKTRTAPAPAPVEPVVAPEPASGTKLKAPAGSPSGLRLPDTPATKLKAPAGSPSGLRLPGAPSGLHLPGSPAPTLKAPEGQGFTFQAAENHAASSPAASGDAGPGFLARFGGLIKLALVVVLVGTVGLGGYLYFTTKAYGITAKAPLGTLAKLDKEFLDMGLMKDSKVVDVPKGFGAVGKIHRYDDKELLNKTRKSIDESVYMVVDAAGKVSAIGGNFYTPDSSVPNTGTRISRFFLYYRAELNLPEPDFKNVHHNDGFSKWSEDVGGVKTDTLELSWVKRGEPMPLYASADDIKICLKGLSAKLLGKQSE